MRELIEHDNTGLLFHEGDSQDLARQCVFAIANPVVRARLGQAAQQWVRRNRQWSTLVLRYNEIYTALLQEPQTGRRAS
jgi:glycosyltransferase involved in cell wall biosynthesis